MDCGLVSSAEHAPAKINLALHVTGQRPDGFHLLESLVVFTEFGDHVTVKAAEEDSFVVKGHFAAQVPLDGGNLVIRARDALREAYAEAAASPVAITLEKNLPIASGIGGGSSDAAAALRALARHWNIDGDLSRLALPLGADVPMCLLARPLVARGIGEIVDPLENYPALPLVLVNPGIGVATPDVFRALESRKNPALSPSPADPQPAHVIEWLRTSRNDLEAPAKSLAPVISEALDALRGTGAAFARMSGSGATCFGVFETRDAAANAATAIGQAKPGWFAVATTSMR
jgi:4-diphosphocytidyl-2-C-methyl-D-erythritol kinase